MTRLNDGVGMQRAISAVIRPSMRRQATPIGLFGSRSSTCSREIV
jgi:hypothetical protein